MADGVPARLGKLGGSGSLADTRGRAGAAFDALEAQTPKKPPPAPPRDEAKVETEARPAEPAPADLVKKVGDARADGDRHFAIDRRPDGTLTVRISGRIDPAVYARQKHPLPRQELRAYAQSTQQWAMLVQSFQTSVVQIQALIATKLEHGQITRAEAQEALRAQYAHARPDRGPPVLRFVAQHPEYQDLFGILGDP